jgi:hypothetical protein
VRNTFHVDHIYPRSKFTASRLRSLGIPDDAIPMYLDRFDRLGNLQLLEGTENVDKRAAMPADWVNRAYPDPAARSGYVVRNDLGGLTTLQGFLDFYDSRRSLMRQRLLDLLGVDPAAAAVVERHLADDAPGRNVVGSTVATRRDIAAHIASAFAGMPDGTFLTVGEIRAHRSKEYGDEFPSSGAIAARLFPASGRCTVHGVSPNTNDRGVRGAHKVAR